MAHSPIQSQKRLGMMEQVVVERGTVGLLYGQGVLQRRLKTGEGLTWKERALGGLQLYVIDQMPHEMRWDVQFRAKGKRDFFPLIITLRYRVADERKMVEEDVRNTEVPVMRLLEPQLRKSAALYSLGEHEEAEVAFEELLTATLFAECGLELLSADVVLDFSEAVLNRIEEIQRVEKAMQVPQQIRYQTELPSKEPAFKFHAEVIMQYRVTDPAKLPRETLDEAAEWLWNEVRPKLRRVSRRHPVNDLLPVEDAMVERLDEEELRGHGLEILVADVEVELNEATFVHAQKLARIEYERLEVEQQVLLDELKQSAALSTEQRYLDHYLPLISGGQWKVLALSLSQNKKDVNEVLGYMDDKDKDKLETQFRLMGMAMKSNRVGEDIADEVFARAGRQLSGGAGANRLLNEGAATVEGPEISAEDIHIREVEEDEPDDGSADDVEEVIVQAAPNDSESPIDDAYETTSGDAWDPAGALGDGGA